MIGNWDTLWRILLLGAVVYLALIALQYAIAAMAVRWRLAERLAKSDPGEALRRERVTRADLLSAARSKGFGDLSVIAAVVLETDGSLRVVSHEHAASRSALPLVRGSS